MKCITCGKNADSSYCFLHKPRKSMKRTALGRGTFLITSQKGKDVLEEAFKRELMQNLFLEIWKERKHHSEVSGTYLGKEPLSVFFHHILPKEKFPSEALKKDNIILLTLQEHSDVENNYQKFPEINRRRELLIKKYNI